MLRSNSKKRKPRQTHHNRRRSIETLEQRQMMAADFLSAVDPLAGSSEDTFAVTSLVELPQDLGTVHGRQDFHSFVGGFNYYDDYRFSLSESAEVSLALDGLAADVDLFLYDASGNELARSWRGGASSELIEVDLSVGTYFARISPWGSAQSNYHFSLEVDGAADLRDLGVVHGMHHFNDWVGGADPNDYYRFELDHASEVALRMNGLSADVDLYLYDANGNEVARSWQGGSSAEDIELDLAAGTYFARVAPWSANQSNYHLSLEVDGAADTRDLGVVQGVHHFSDWVGRADAIDDYRFELHHASEVTLRMDGLSADIDLYLYDANGNEVARSWRGGSSAEDLQLELEAGTYFARVAPWSTAESNYQLSLEVVASDVEDLGVVGGMLHLHDWVGHSDSDDYYRFELAEAAELTLRLDQLSADVDLYLYDAAGHEIARSWRGGPLAERIEVDLAAGSYMARVTPWSTNQSNYHLSLEVDGAADLRDLGVVSGTLHFNDWVGQADANDYYMFELTSPSEVALRMDQLTADIDLYLYDIQGNEVARSWRGGSSSEEIELNLTAGTYIARVVPWSSNESNYHLSLAVGSGDSNDVFPDVPDYGGANDWNLNAINAPEVWAEGYTGSGVVVAVIDTGVDYFHSELDANLWTNTGEIAGNGFDDDGNGFVDDVHGWDFVSDDNTPADANGHGTHVAGTIAAERNGYGATGVAYNALIMPVQVLSANGSGTVMDVAAGIRYAADNGAHIINLSLGGGYSSAIESAIVYAGQMGVFVAAAAGNEAADMPGFPARFANAMSHVLSVGAHDSSNQLADFSNLVGGSGAVQVDAPGVSVFSTLPGEDYNSFNGTSMASPHVAGLAALALSANPYLTASQLRQLIVQGADRAITGSDSAGGINAAHTVAMAVGTAGSALTSPTLAMGIAPAYACLNSLSQSLSVEVAPAAAVEAAFAEPDSDADFGNVAVVDDYSAFDSAFEAFDSTFDDLAVALV